MPLALRTNIAKKGAKELQRVSFVPSPVASVPLRKEDDPLQVVLQKIAVLEACLVGNSTTKESGSKSRLYTIFTHTSSAGARPCEWQMGIVPL